MCSTGRKVAWSRNRALLAVRFESLSLQCQINIACLLIGTQEYAIDIRWYPRWKMELKGLISYVTTVPIKNRHLSNAFSTLQKVSQELLHNRICSYASSLLVASAPLLQCRCSFPQITWPSTMVAELSVINNALGTVLPSRTTTNKLKCITTENLT